MTPDYCPHYHINKGEAECWKIYDSHERRKEYRLLPPCGCEGNEERCDFEKIGGEEE